MPEIKKNMETVPEEGSDEGYRTAEDEIPLPKVVPHVEPNDLRLLTDYKSFEGPKSQKEEIKHI